MTDPLKNAIDTKKRLEEQIDLVLSKPEPLTEEERNELRACWRSFDGAFTELIKVFDSIRKACDKIDLDIDNAVRLLESFIQEMSSDNNVHDEIQERINNRPEDDKYKSIWNELDVLSKKYIATAEYLLERCTACNMDYSPVIVEFCRVYENELLTKAFKEFVTNYAQSGHAINTNTYTANGRNNTIKTFKKAIDNEMDNGRFFLSSENMVWILDLMRYVKNHGGSSSIGQLENDFINYLQTKFEIDRFNYSFRDNSLKYIRDYRNAAAHPGQIFNNDSCLTCMNETSALTQGFFQSRLNDPSSIDFDIPTP